MPKKMVFDKEQYFRMLDSMLRVPEMQQTNPVIEKLKGVARKPVRKAV